MLEGESLFNDATALVALRVLGGRGGRERHGGPTPWAEFVAAAVGAVVVGFRRRGRAISFVRRRVTRLGHRHRARLLATAPYLAFLPAERLHASGVLAVVVAGLVLAHRSPVDQQPTARLVEGATGGTIARLLEGTVFVLIGFELR